MEGEDVIGVGEPESVVCLGSVVAGAKNNKGKLGEDDVTRSIAKVVQGSSKTRRAILTKRPTSFWA